MPHTTSSPDRLKDIKRKVREGFYSSDEVSQKITDKLGDAFVEIIKLKN